MPSAFLNSSARYSTIFASKSSPPRKVSPLVAFTSKTPSPISRPEMSKVPPPRSQRSEEHTSELQSLMRIPYGVFCFNKKQSNTRTYHTEHIMQHHESPCKEN